MENKNEPTMEDILAELHEAVADELLNRVRSGAATSGDLSAAIKMLKDNNITISKDNLEDSQLGNLLEYLPGFDLEGIPDRRLN
jgi:hypothetical protein